MLGPEFHAGSSAEGHQPVDVVGQDPESGPDGGSGVSLQAGSSESVFSLQATDSSFRTSSPSVPAAPVSSPLHGIGSSFARNHLVLDASSDKGGVAHGVAVAAVGGDARDSH